MTTIVIFIFLVMMLAGLLIIFLQGNDTARSQDVLRRMSRQASDRPAEIAITREDPRKRGKGRFMDRIFARVDMYRRLEEYMWQGGIYWRASEVVLVMVLLVVAGAMGGWAWFGDPLFALAGGAALGILPLLFIRFRQKRRLKEFNRQLPEMLDLLKSSLQAGHSLIRGLQVVSEEFADPVSTETRMVLEQTRLGVPLPRSLDAMLKRIPEESLRFLVTAVKIQSDVGTSLAEIVERLAETVRNRQRVQLQIRTLTAQGRMSGMVVGLLPVAVLCAFSLIQPGYAHTLFYDPMGIKLFKAAVVLDVLAFFTIRRIMRLDY